VPSPTCNEQTSEVTGRLYFGDPSDLLGNQNGFRIVSHE
jgi:hypothetical protein